MTEDTKITVPMQNTKSPTKYKNCEGYLIPEDWKVVHFKSLFNRLQRKNTENNQNVLTISAQQGLVSQMDYYNTLYASENKRDYSLLHRGDFSYNKSYSADYAYGAIKRLDAYDKGIVSPLYICFEPKIGTNSDFYLQYFEAGMFNREIYKIAQEGARNHGLLNVSSEDFFNTVLVYPPLKEQERITEILIQCDKVIELKQKILEEEKKQKKWLMEQFFALEGKHTRIKLRDCGKWYGGGTPDKGEPLYWKNGTIKWISSQEVRGLKVSETTYKITPKAVNESTTNIVPAYSLVIVTRSGILKRTLPVSYIDERMAINQDIKALTPAANIDYYYLMSYLKYKEKEILASYVKTGTTVQSLIFNLFLNYEISFPEYKEQQKVAKILRCKDEEIDLLEEEISYWRQKKKALMQLLLTGIVRVN